MNIIEYSFRLGYVLNKTDLGKEIKKEFHSLEENYNNCSATKKEHYQLFNRYVEDICSKHHFFGWKMAYENIINYPRTTHYENEDKGLLVMAEQIKEDEQYRLMSEAGARMGEIVNNIIMAIFTSNHENMDIIQIKKIAKVKNAIMDLQMSVERSGIKRYLIEKTRENSIIDEKYEAILGTKDYIPYLVDRPQQLETGDNIYYEMADRLAFTQYMISLGIFEGFWGIVKELTNDDIIDGRILQLKGMRKGEFTHGKVVGELIKRESWIYKIYNNDQTIYFIANARTISFSKKECNCKIQGVFYPEEDIGMFLKKDLFEC